MTKNKNKINIKDIKETMNPDNNKVWWNTRDGFIIKTTYNESTNRYSIHKHEFNVVPNGIPIHFQTNMIPQDY